MFIAPTPYVAAVVLVLAIMLYITLRTDGWLPRLRMLMIRRMLILMLLAWGAGVLLAPLYASEKKPALPVAHRWDKPIVPASNVRKNIGSSEYQYVRRMLDDVLLPPHHVALIPAG